MKYEGGVDEYQIKSEAVTMVMKIIMAWHHLAKWRINKQQ